MVFCTPIKKRTHAGPGGPEPNQQNLDVYISAAARVNLAFRFLPHYEIAGLQFYLRCSPYMWILERSVWCRSASARMRMAFYWGAVNWRVWCGAPSCSMYFRRRAPKSPQGRPPQNGKHVRAWFYGAFPWSGGSARLSRAGGHARMWRGRAMLASGGRKARHARHTNTGSGASRASRASARPQQTAKRNRKNKCPPPSGGGHLFFLLRLAVQGSFFSGGAGLFFGVSGSGSRPLYAYVFLQ